MPTKNNITMQMKYIIRLLTVALVMQVCVSCSDDDDENNVSVAPQSADAVFNYTREDADPNTINFTGVPARSTWYTHWSFGDGSSAEGLEATKTYFKKGIYEVRFKIFTDGGTADSVQLITIESDIVDESNLVQNGDFGSTEGWSIFEISPGMDINLDNGTALWSGGGGGHAGLYQEITVEADVAYQINMDVFGSGATDSWFEVYAGVTEPQPNTDYSDGGMLMGLSTWGGCGDAEFNDKLVNISCNGGDGSVSFTAAGIVYLVIRGGGADYGAEGIGIDNVEMRPI
ncbi:MAG: PKD repeat protein [Cyclobacteriaceae bacterium]|jgi:PKD repeat protein